VPPALRVGFAGTPPFAATALGAIVEAGFTVPLVLTQPDRPKGRGLTPAASPVKTLAVRERLAVLQPPSLRAEEARVSLLAVPLDVLVVAAFGLILPPPILDWPRLGCLNIHASHLPRWRGAAPIQRAILAGDPATGVTIMQMDAGLDTGPMIEVVPVPIVPRETAGSLHDKLAAAGAQAIVGTLRTLATCGSVNARPQPAAGVTYAAKVTPEEAVIDWTADADAIDRQVRAFDPAPGAYTLNGGTRWKIWSAHARAASGEAAPGTVLEVSAQHVLVQCGSGALAVTTLQPAGGRRLGAREVADGRRIRPGDVLGASPPAAH
jgi:methionyl-tRNA formyltransferase